MKTINKTLLFITVLTMSDIVFARALTGNEVTKNKLNLSYSAKDSVTKKNSEYGITWNMELDYEPYEFLDNKYKFSLDFSADSSKSESSTEKIEAEKYGLGLKFAATENQQKIKPFISFGIENVKESKVNSIESVNADFNSSFKWGLGFTFPIVDPKKGDNDSNPILGLEVEYYKNYDSFPFQDKVYSEFEISLVFDIFALLNN